MLTSKVQANYKVKKIIIEFANITTISGKHHQLTFSTICIFILMSDDTVVRKYDCKKVERLKEGQAHGVRSDENRR